ncbi:MAG: 3-hydroxyacyl-CoA dehydrogenase [Saprospiraceae bacterium]|nr:3-hydroxyacyl-CoA dehydrogenase [Saprospiraceae bacterium]
MGTRHINKVAVIGSGIMGSGIACHLSNAGIEVVLLDIVTPGLSDDQLRDKQARNQHVNQSLQNAIKSKPAPLMHSSFASRIKTGNIDDDLSMLKSCDWVIEVVVERLDIKQQLYEKIEPYLKPGAIVSSNTSGIPIHFLSAGRSEAFRKNFVGTHFFNPPRYLRLLEIIPTPDTDPELVSFLMAFGSKHLGKQTVLCKDTPAFIANRIGVYAMAKIFQLTEELNISLTDADKLTGPALGRPKTGTFRLGDLVGHDTAAKVIEGIRQNCPDDEQAGAFTIPAYFRFLLDNKYFGNKSGQGFYKKTDQKDDKGKPIILSLNLKTHEYELPVSQKYQSLEVSKQIDSLGQRLKAIIKLEDAGAELIKRSLSGLFAYASNRVPEISDTLYSIDDALRAGFAWEVGPFEYWDLIGLDAGLSLIEKYGEKPAGWVLKMRESGNDSFYKASGGKVSCYDVNTGTYAELPGASNIIKLEYFKDKKPVLENPEMVLHDIGDGILCLEFRSKSNAIGEGILRGLDQAITLAEEDGWKGLVIGNNAQNFTVGANLMMIAMMAYQQEFDELNMAVNMFQQTMMRCRYSSIPVVISTQGYVFGGGCEMLMHCDASAVAAESYIGLVEVGVGLIPGGGGTKEFAVRTSDAFHKGDVMMPTLIEKFKTIATASVATSGYEGYDLGYLNHKDKVILNTAGNIAEAKKIALQLSDGYQKPIIREDIYVLGRGGIATLYIAAHTLKLGNYASEHDIKIAKKLAHVMCGGDLTGPQKVSEQYLLDLEREAFLSLCGEPKTLERIQSILTTNKPLRN